MGKESKYFKTYPDTSSSDFSVAGSFVILCWGFLPLLLVERVQRGFLGTEGG